MERSRFRPRQGRQAAKNAREDQAADKRGSRGWEKGHQQNNLNKGSFDPRSSA
jgi:hypothetical protein